MIIVPTIEQLCSQSSRKSTICSKCSKKFQGESAMKIHLRRTHKIFETEDQDKQYYCPIDLCCHNRRGSSPFSTFASVKQHYKLVHGKERFKCSRCERVFKSKYTCKQHEVECGINYVCSCNVKYTSKRGLLDHVKRQNHQLPPSLRSLFQLTANKRKQRFLPKKPTSSRSRATSNIILPKTLKKKVRLFRLMPTCQNPSNFLARNLKLVDISAPTIPILNASSDQRNTMAVKVGFSQTVTTPDEDQSVAGLKPAENIILKPTTNNTWQHKNISIQTERDLPSTDWIANDHCLLFENIGTQTIENVYKEAAIETDSAFCQTDLSHFCSTDDDHHAIWDHSSYRNYADHPVLCDAQNQTVSHTSNSFTNLQADFTSDPISVTQVPTSHISSSIETQTEIPINFNSAQTQTHQDTSSLGERASVSTDVSALDVLLNDIETQTEFFLPTPVENTFVHSCTQTPGHDFLYEILNLET